MYGWLSWPAADAWAAIATLLAVLVALFGDWFRSLIPWLQPRLKLELIERPEPVTSRLTSPDGNTRDEGGFYFYGKVSNPNRRVRAATQVQVFLVRQESKLANGKYEIISIKEVPIEWHLQKAKSLHATVGSEETFPICSIVKNKWVQIHPLIEPLILKRTWREGFSIVLTFQAKSVEVESNLLRIEIAWDGKWADDRENLRFHLTVTEAPL